MKALAVLTAGLSLASALSDAQQRVPTRHESAVMGRRILALTKLGTLSTVFPQSPNGSGTGDALEDRPGGLGGLPFGLMDYVADCEDEGNPTLLAIGVQTNFKNARAGSNMTLSLRWTPPYPPARRISVVSRLSRFLFAHGESDPVPDTSPYSAANLPRLALVGHLQTIGRDSHGARLTECYLATHPDARYWLPGGGFHDAEWMRLVVEQVYWVGGFGDRAYIGWIPVEEWRRVTAEEWGRIRLPGEKKGWSEWGLNEL